MFTGSQFADVGWELCLYVYEYSCHRSREALCDCVWKPKSKIHLYRFRKTNISVHKKAVFILWYLLLVFVRKHLGITALLSCNNSHQIHFMHKLFLLFWLYDALCAWRNEESTIIILIKKVNPNKGDTEKHNAELQRVVPGTKSRGNSILEFVYLPIYLQIDGYLRS